MRSFKNCLLGKVRTLKYYQNFIKFQLSNFSFSKLSIYFTPHLVRYVRNISLGVCSLTKKTSKYFGSFLVRYVQISTSIIEKFYYCLVNTGIKEILVNIILIYIHLMIVKCYLKFCIAKKIFWMSHVNWH